MSDDIAIQVRGLGKKYRIGGSQEKYHTFRDAIIHSIKAPFRRFTQQRTDLSKNEFWALKDVSFEVKKGEVIGVIGRNGAGKSTLLKILSRITTPTEGEVDIYGRLGSLLEVGTGFHPELTGRENIFLSGSILGMQKLEIEEKLDAIVKFSEIEKFLDTPVKRYSSGMYVRLAFAVAAHMDTEILLVDEVLAVGDAAFQKKCLGKMGDVAKEGRTVLFVSHNMAAIENLCNRAVLLQSGGVVKNDNASEVIQYYLKDIGVSQVSIQDLTRKGNGTLYVKEIAVCNAIGEKTRVVYSGKDMSIALKYSSKQNSRLTNVIVSIAIDTIHGERICVLQNDYVGIEFSELEPQGEIVCHIPKLPLNAGIYRITIFITVNKELADWIIGAKNFSVEPGDYYGTGKGPDIQDGKIYVQHFFEYIMK